LYWSSRLYVEILFLNGTVTLGGSTAKYLCEHLLAYDTDWSKWRVFFCDERHVSETDPESTYGFYNKHLFSHVSLSKEHIFEDNTNLSGRFSIIFVMLCSRKDKVKGDIGTQWISDLCNGIVKEGGIPVSRRLEVKCGTTNLQRKGDPVEWILHYYYYYYYYYYYDDSLNFVRDYPGEPVPER